MAAKRIFSGVRVCIQAEASALDHLYDISSLILSGAGLDETLDRVFETFHDVIPYDRIGFAEIKDGNAVARWCRSNGPVLLRYGYSAPLEGSSLSLVVSRGLPRILNNLPEYLEHRPQSHSTARIVREGMKSSMTCPLFVADEPVGILFFSSRNVDAYTEEHVLVLKEIAMHIALLLMASQHGDCETPGAQSFQQPPKGPEQEHGSAATQELLFSQVEPGMVLAEPICGRNEETWVAKGTELHQQLIERLSFLRRNGFAQFDRVCVFADSVAAAQPERV